MSAPAGKPDVKARKDAVLAASLAWLSALYRMAGWGALEDAIADAIRSGMAEGEANALAVAAVRQGATGFAFDRALKDAYGRLAGDASIAQRAADVAGKMVRGAAADLSVKLPPLTEDDASEAGITKATESTVTGNDVRTVRSWLSDALWAATGAGAVALYQRASQSADSGVVMVNWVTESGNPCPQCLYNEAMSPYAPWNVPDFPGHPNCRCELDTADDIPSSFFSAYVFS